MKRENDDSSFSTRNIFCKSIKRSFLSEFIYYFLYLPFHLFPYLNDSMTRVDWTFCNKWKVMLDFLETPVKNFELFHVIKGNKMYGLITDRYQSLKP